MAWSTGHGLGAHSPETQRELLTRQPRHSAAGDDEAMQLAMTASSPWNTFLGLRRELALICPFLRLEPSHSHRRTAQQKLPPFHSPPFVRAWLTCQNAQLRNRSAVGLDDGPARKEQTRRASRALEERASAIAASAWVYLTDSVAERPATGEGGIGTGRCLVIYRVGDPS